ncbi:hypothetical protein [Chelativorans alearense]|uniref:hypothetical protein n=1 Tax=Chelativorans alearense TaxID=2681495 RepID=UPI0013D5B3CC|nr:hypothetical protein [Chelativorans alearense]
MNEVETVKIKIGEEELTLTPSPKAMSKVSQAFGGILNAVDRVQRFDTDAIAFAIAAGADLAEAEREALPRRIFATGITELLVPTVRFLGLLASGGRRSKPADEKAA